METRTYKRKPFYVEAIEITEENIDAVGAIIGEVFTQGDSGVKFIAVNNSIVPGVKTAHIGFWLTVMGNRYRCYHENIFHQQFELSRDTTVVNLPDGDPNQMQIVDVMFDMYQRGLTNSED